MAQIGKADFKNLGFNFVPTNSIIVADFRDGKWSEPRSVNVMEFNINFFAGALHYASSCFEGLKAFRGVDGKVRIFRPDANAARMQSSGDFLGMPYPTVDMFVEMCLRCVKENIDFLPPYGMNASLYLRPLLFGSNPQLGVRSSVESTFAVMCAPVGSYTGAASLFSVNAVIARNYDRAAPNGTGHFKLSANYAPSMKPYGIAHASGYSDMLFLDPATKTKIDEFGSSNFLAIKGNSYVTPLSDSVLPSITNASLQVLAADCGLKVEKRIVPVEELAEMDEVNACGTAVVLTPIYAIDDKVALEDSKVTRSYNICKKGDVGETSKKLYLLYRGIQDGVEQDIHNWCVTL